MKKICDILFMIVVAPVAILLITIYLLANRQNIVFDSRFDDE